MTMFPAADKMLKVFLKSLLVILAVVILILTFLQVFVRYFRIPVLSWAEEIVRLLLVWAAFLGVSILNSDRSHIQVDFFHNKLPEKWKRINNLLYDLFLLTFSAICIYFGYIVSKSAINDLSTGLGYPRALFYLPVPVSGFFSLFFILPNILKDVKAIFMVPGRGTK
jgi:TRAP-type C4-dicarboxylate transport system permease small subunit